MDEKIYRCYVEKRPGHDTVAKALRNELAAILDLSSITVRLFNRYDIQRLPEEKWQDVIDTVLHEPMSDFYYEEHLPSLPEGTHLLFIESIPGQFDVCSDSCEQCVQMLLGGEKPVVHTAKVYAIGGIDKSSLEQIKAYLINPLECREASPNKPDTTLEANSSEVKSIPIIEGFINMDAKALEKLRIDLGMAMSADDLLMLQKYFLGEGRDLTITELRVIDTYWSDHCRHTTFNTIIDNVDIQDSRVQKSYDIFKSVLGEKPVTFMNIATAAMNYFSKKGELPMLDVSEENNACTVKINVEFESGQEEWLLFFKNETHNHPTEIEPFGGASTCVGGAIRDPLSGRAYVYQAMRITGSGDPRKSIQETLPGKLPQRKITVTAAEGFSSYGNQIGLATGYVKEIYHEGYIAKRLEAGAVVGAVPAEFVRRGCPEAGDVVILLGGRTGRDGVGGATGSSKTHGVETVVECASEVQKGNAPEERKLQRLFRNRDVTKLVKRCNDFGAGGAAVAIGELAEGVEINLDAIPVKYEGLDGTELAISESQERIAVIVAEKDLSALLYHAETENVEASVVAKVTEEKRLVMTWRGEKIVDIARDFLDTSGAGRSASVSVPPLDYVETQSTKLSLSEKIYNLVNDLNFCSQKGLVERFDSSIGASSVFMPFGGKKARTEMQVMAALIPKQGARTASVMAYGFDPYFMQNDPFAGSASAVVTSVAKLVASGVDIETIHLSLQEYFPRLNDDPKRWGVTFAAMLGAFSAQMGLKVAAIGGKDSMSGSFANIDVPPTLISFAVGVSAAKRLISTEFKAAGNPVYILNTPLGDDGLQNYTELLAKWKRYAKLCDTGKVLSAWVCEKGGAYGGIVKMAFGNMIGFAGKEFDGLSNRLWGSIIFETSEELADMELLGYTQEAPTLTFGETNIGLEELYSAWEAPLEGIFPVKTDQQGETPLITDNKRSLARSGGSIVKPKAVIPVFPGTNCEYDTAEAIEKAGGSYEFVLIRNLTPDMLSESIEKLDKAISSAQMLVFPGGFSGGDEPDGSGKFIVSLFRNNRLTEKVHELLYSRDGLVLGICNGFQALIKLGLLPYGKIMKMSKDCPTLTFNNIGRHQARYVNTRVASAMSPWLSKCNTGELYTQPISHGEGRFIASPEVLETMKKDSQIAFQYTDYEGMPSMDIEHNPNGSIWAIEGICSPDGRILGKMAHTERVGEYVAKNIVGNKFLPLFEGGVGYFK